MRRRYIVVSATNISFGGPLSVLEDFLKAWAQHGDHTRAKVIVFFGGKQVLRGRGISVVRTPWVAGSWLGKAIFEFISARSIERRLRPALWLSLQDSVPRIAATRLWLYCHNAVYLGQFRARYLLFAAGMVVQRIGFSAWLSMLIGRCERVIAQQAWVVHALRERFGYRGKLTVCRPSLPPRNQSSGEHAYPATRSRRTPHVPVVIYPAYPRVHKNIESAIRAVELASRIARAPMQLVLTFSGNENLYARYVHWRFRASSQVAFAGFLSRERLFLEYERADAMLFTSELETWGLPLTEFASTGKPIVAFDYPFVRETLRGASRIWLSKPDSIISLARCLVSALRLDAVAETPIPAAEPDSMDLASEGEALSFRPDEAIVDMWADWSQFVRQVNEAVRCVP